MRLIALADVHGDDNVLYMVKELNEQHSPDMVVIAGDLTHFGPADWAEILVRELVSLGLHVAAVPGNCDPPELDQAIERGGGISLHDSRKTIGGVVFAGLGGSNPTPFPTMYWRSEEDIILALENILDGTDVLVSHAPPLGKNDFNAHRGTHTGSSGLAMLIERARPRVVITGHIHEARGIAEEDGIIYINPGMAGSGLAGMVDIDAKKASARLL